MISIIVMPRTHESGGRMYPTDSHLTSGMRIFTPMFEPPCRGCRDRERKPSPSCP
ncbi:MAG: hypothetical protein BWY82_02424 [Verrucomicrobia bacterium ADurb.Bin474]|nr:MAG: hypothetical protein BWY82_02424 [Verrucomicrobia bacterium ADurb.Bin474]